MSRLATQLFCIALLLLSQAASAGCWTPQDRAFFRQGEMEGHTLLSFRDAVSCEPVIGAEVTFGKQSFTTDNHGLVSIETLATSMDEQLQMTVKKRGYLTLKRVVRLELGGVVHNRFPLSPLLSGEVLRFVLSWNVKPSDLDLHLQGPDFHISYRDMKNARNKARLDIDAQEGYGPETITLKRIDASKRYRLWVDLFSRDGRFTGTEQVDVYAHGAMDRSLALPATGERRVEILTIEDGQINYTLKPF